MASVIPLFVAVFAIIGIAALFVMSAVDRHKKLAGVLTWYAGLGCVLFVAISMKVDEDAVVFILKTFILSGAGIFGLMLSKSRKN